MNFFADRMKDFARAAQPTQVSQVTPSSNTRSGRGRGEDSPSAARDDRIAFEEFKKTTGRSDKNPYGDAGMFGADADYRASTRPIIGDGSNSSPRDFGMSQSTINQLNRQAYNQYLGLVSGRGTQRGGQGEFVPGYAPALKLGSETPRGTVVAAPNQSNQGGIFSLSPTLGLIKSLFGSGNIPRTLDDSSLGAVNYSTEGIETLMTPSAAPIETSNIARSPTLVSAQPRKNNKFTVPFNLDQVLRDVPKTGIGRFIEQGMPIAANPNFSLPPNPKTETDAEFEARMDRKYGANMDELINRARVENYLEKQSDVGVYTPPVQRPSYTEGNLLTDRREIMPEQFGGFADPLVGGTLSDLLNRQTQSPLPNTYSPRRIAREALLSGRPFQGI